MPNIFAPHAVADSITTFLRNTYPEPLRTDHPFAFTVASSADMAKESPYESDTVSIYMFRMAVDRYLHPVSREGARQGRRRTLQLDLHYLVTVWAEDEFAEQTVMAWVMAQLHWNPVLDRSTLSPVGGWHPGDTVQLIQTETSQEDLTRIWDVVGSTMRLSSTYCARSVQIDPPETEPSRPVVAVRHQFEPVEV